MQGRHGDPRPRVQQVVDGLLAGNKKPRVLEAGCGSLSRIELPPGRRITGIDIEQRQLDRNTSLDEKILGDLQSFEAPVPGFDLVLCWDVVEHLPEPTKALERLTAALNPGGGLVLAFPHLWSLKGLATKFTPYVVHAFFYRYVMRDKRRDDEWDQFPTFFRASIAPRRLRRWSAEHGLEIIYEEVYEGPVQTDLRLRGRWLDLSFAALGAVSRILSFGRLDLGLSDCILVLRLPEGRRI
jgi:2-polyprenyl-3-methyl-5-hydroxy-6-metoxy-1,4-benzoquinol methylase